MKHLQPSALLTNIFALYLLSVTCALAAEAEKSRMVAVCTFRASDKATEQAIRDALQAAHIRWGMTSLGGGTTVSVSAEDEPAARKIVQELLETKKLPIYPVESVEPADVGKSHKPPAARRGKRA